MPAYIKTLKEGTNIVYPQTKIEAVFGEDGTNLLGVLDDMQNDIDDINPIIESIQDDISNNASNIESLQNSVTTLRTDLTDTQDDLDETKSDLSDLRTEFENSSSVIHYIVKLSSSGWNENNQQTVAVADAKIDNVIMVSPDDDSLDECIDCGVLGDSKVAGYVTFKCEEIPENDIIINLIIADTEPIDLAHPSNDALEG